MGAAPELLHRVDHEEYVPTACWPGRCDDQFRLLAATAAVPGRQTPTVAAPPTGLYGLRRRLLLRDRHRAFLHGAQSIWLSAAPDSDGRLCLDCLQPRLGRDCLAALGSRA